MDKVFIVTYYDGNNHQVIKYDRSINTRIWDIVGPEGWDNISAIEATVSVYADVTIRAWIWSDYGDWTEVQFND